MISKSNQPKKISKIIWLMMLGLSAIFSITAQFSEWLNGQSAWDLYFLTTLEKNYYVYIFPIIGASLVIFLIILVKLKIPRTKFLIALIFIAILNLFLIILLEMINAEQQYLWNYPGIYMMFLAIFFYLFGTISYFLNYSIQSQS